MILFTILLLALIILTVVTIIVISVFGAGAIVIFGDVIVCIALITIILRSIIKKRRKDRD